MAGFNFVNYFGDTVQESTSQSIFKLNFNIILG
jgi:hypothetical protein